MTPARVLLLPGDGIGPEVIAQAAQVLRLFNDRGDCRVEINSALIGGHAIDQCHTPLPANTIAAVRDADAVLLGAVGAPAYDHLPNDQKPEKGLLQLRQEMGVFANLRPAICHPALASSSSLKTDLVADLDILIVRELIGGIYFGTPRGINTHDDERVGINTMHYTEHEIMRVGRAAFAAAQKRNQRLCSVDKANVLEVSALWREVITTVGQREFPEVALSHMYVDNAAMQLVRAPKQFDVILTSNLFGDILSDIAAMLTGSIGMLPSAAVNESGRGLYEPVHGSAPDLAGQDCANPLAAILSVAMMLRHSLAAPAAADKVTAAVREVLADGWRTADIATADETPIGCAAMGQQVLTRIEAHG